MKNVGVSKWQESVRKFLPGMEVIIIAMAGCITGNLNYEFISGQKAPEPLYSSHYRGHDFNDG